MHRAQSTMEYIYILGILAVALIATATYMKRGIQGYWRSYGDQVGEQYSPGYMDISINETQVVNTEVHSNSTSSTVYGNSDTGVRDQISTSSSSDVTDDYRVSRNVSENTHALSNEYWGPTEND